jgi:GPH family glycoside/pentoside/hexuronide:cation symporter
VSATPSELAAPRPLEPSATDTRADRLPLPIKVSYASGQLVELVVGSMLNVFVLFYVTAACGMPGWLAGIALGAGLVVDAVMEPLIGSLTDGWRSRYGRRVPFMVAGLLPTVVTFNLIFALPSGTGDVALFLWLMLLSVSLRISMSVYTLPYQALGAELSDDYAERSSIVAWRWGIGILGTVAVIGLGYGVFLKDPESLSNRASYLPLTLSLSLVLVAGALIAIRTGLLTRHRQHETVAPSTALHVRLPGEILEVFRNPTFRILFGSMLLFNISAGVSQALGLHLGTFFWRLDSAQLQGLATAAVIGLAVGAPLAAPLGSRIEKRTMLIIGKTGMFICNAVPVTLKLLGLLTISEAALTLFLATTAFLSGAAMGLSIIAFLSIVADAADEHEYLFGTRREGLYFAGWSFAAKSATGAGLLIAGVVLQLIDFPTNLAEQGASAATLLPERTVTWLGIAGGPGGALLSVIAIAMILLYRLDKATHAHILAQLNARRAERA